MKMKKSVFTVALAAALAASVPGTFTADTPVLTGAVCEATEYSYGGMEIHIPTEYDDLLYTKVFTENEDGYLFSVTEAKSVADSWRQNQRESGPGWLFTIGRVSASRMRQMICRDMSGEDIFAKDAEGNYYVYYHPTDVRLVRRDNEAMARDQKLWSDLTRWASQDARYDFIEVNKGLTGVSYDNSDVAMHLAQAAYGDVDYTLSSNQYGPLAPGDVDAAPYVERLICGASYEMVDNNLTPDGEYVVLNFPGEKVRYDFFLLSGKENYVRVVRADSYDVLYKATFNDGTTRAGSVMKQWYSELAAAR